MAIPISTIGFQTVHNTGIQVGINNGTINLPLNHDSPKTLAEQSHLRLRSGWLDGTCDWLFKRDEFIAWADNQNQFSTLYMDGIAGCGKSTLVSRVIDWLNEKSRIHLLYFYIDRSHDRLHDLRVVLMALSEQLGMNVSNNKTREELLDGLLASLDYVDWPVYIIIDALDRLHADDQTWLLKHFLQPCHANPRVAILVTSTNSEISIYLAETQSNKVSGVKTHRIRVGGAVNSQDIRKYVKHKLQEAKSLPTESEERDDIINKVSEKLTERADGMFLLAMLQATKICENETVRGILDSLNNLPLPGKTKEMYDEIVHGFDSKPPVDRKIAKRAVALMAYEMRSIPARVFLVAIAVDRAGEQSGNYSHQSQNVDEGLLSELRRNPEKVTRACQNLVEFDNQRNVFRFHHDSVHEYFEECKPEWTLPLISKISLSYLCSQGLSEGPCENASWYNPEDLERRLQEYPLLEFASCHWPLTIRKGHMETVDCLVDFCQRFQNMQLSFQVVLLQKRKLMATDICPAHIMSYFGLIDFFESLHLKELLDPLQCDSHGLTAIHWAIESETNNSCAMVKEWIDRGADINAKDTRGRTPLYYAARNGKLTVVEVLLEKGAEVNARCEKNRTALIVASSNNHEGIVRSLIKHRANVNLTSDMGTALHAAILKGAGSCVFMILKKARLNVKDRFGTPVHTAAFHGHHEIVDMLLDHGFKVNKKSKEFGSTLAAAAAGCYEAKDSSHYRETFQVLFKHGVRVNTRGGPYGTALHAAAAYGHIDLIKLLLDKGAIVDDKGPMGTPYQIAKNAGYREVMQLLESRGACVSASPNDYPAPVDHLIHISVSRTWGLVFKVALATDDVKRIDPLVNYYEKALERCIEQGQDNIIEWMTSVGESIFNAVIALATKGDSQETEDLSQGRISKKLAYAAFSIFEHFRFSMFKFLRRRMLGLCAPNKPPLPSRANYEGSLVLDRLTKAGMSILRFAIQCNRREATTMIANTWVTALYSVMVQGNYGKRLLEILVKSRADELMQILSDTSVKDSEKFENAERLVRVGVELLATAFKRGPEFRPLARSLSQLWVAAFQDIEKLDGDHRKDVERLIGTIISDFRDCMESSDQERMIMLAEVGIEVARAMTPSGGERLFNIVVCALGEMCQETIDRSRKDLNGLENLVDSLIRRRSEEVEECIKNGQHSEAYSLANISVRLLDVSLSKGFDDVTKKISNALVTALQQIKKQLQGQQKGKQQIKQHENDSIRLLDSVGRLICTAREKGDLLDDLTKAVLDVIETTPSVSQQLRRYAEPIQIQSDFPGELTYVFTAVGHILHFKLPRH